MQKRTGGLLRSWILASIGAVGLNSAVAAAELVNCTTADLSAPGDELSHPFFISGYPGVTLEKVVLWLAPDEAGGYSYRMTVREGLYNGAVIGQATADYTFTNTEVEVPVPFDFGRIMVSSGATLTFTMEQTAGSGTTTYEVAHSESCPLTETEDDTPPLGTVRNNGVYALMFGETTAPDTNGALESPLDGSTLSGIYQFRGWLCDAKRVVLELDSDSEQRYEAAYGTVRPDTQTICGDTDNGFSLLFNLNELGAGSHTVRVFADGVRAATAQFTVETLGTSYLTGVSGTFTLSDFPEAGEEVDVRWLQDVQNFMIIDHR